MRTIKPNMEAWENVSSLDLLVRRLMIFTQFFTKGWGDPELWKKLINMRPKVARREQLVSSKDYPVYIDKEWKAEEGIIVLDGHFRSPLTEVMPGVMPEAAEVARFQIVVPVEWKTDLKPMCIQLSRTGDHGFRSRRKKMAIPLLKEDGIGSIILESPFYGSRKPNYQTRSNLCYVTDMFVMGGALVLESQVLFHWCERMGYGPLGIHGVSLGGFIASIAGSYWDKPLSIIPCMSWTSPSVVYTEGPLKFAIPWGLLERQYAMNDVFATEILDMMCSPEPSLNNGHETLKAEKRMPKTQQYTKAANLPEHSDRHTDVIGNKSVSQPTPVAQSQLVASRKWSWETMFNGIPLSIAIKPLSIAIKNGFSTITGSLSLEIVTNLVLGVMSSVSSVVKSWKRREMFPEQNTQLRSDCERLMHALMDECSHMGNFAVPVDPALAIILVGEFDAYIPRQNVTPMDEIWPGSEVRYTQHGHVTGILSNHSRQLMRNAIRDSFRKQIDKYY